MPHNPNLTPEQVAAQQQERAARNAARSTAAAGEMAVQLTQEQFAALTARLASLEAERAPQMPQTGDSAYNRDKSQQLAEIVNLCPTPGQRLAMPAFVQRMLPENPKDLYAGSIPLVPAVQMPISPVLQKMLQDTPNGTSSPGSLKYETQFVVTNMSILDLLDQWQQDYRELVTSVLAAHPDLSALLIAPLSSLDYMQHWLAAIASGRLSCIEMFMGDGGKPAMESLNSTLFGSAARFTHSTPATLQHAAAVDAAIMKEQVKEAAARVVRGSGGSGSSGGGSSNRGRGRGGRSGGRTGGYGSRGGGFEGSSANAGADRT